VGYRKTPFLGGETTSRSRNLAYFRAVNIYPEFVQTKDGAEVGAFFGCPGLSLLTSLGNGPVRQVYAAANGVLYVVSGNAFYSVTGANWAIASLGTIGSIYGNVSIIENSASQLQIVDGTGAWVYNYSTATFSAVTLPSGVVPSVSAAQDGFALINNVGTNQFYQSNLNDFTTYQGLNFSAADSTPDQIVAMFDIHREVWIFKKKTTEVWVNAGNAGFAFQRLQGVNIQTGCVAPYSTSRLGEGIAWLGQDEQGKGIVYLTNGYAATRISTNAVEEAINGYSLITDAFSYSYQQEGHVFYVLTFPSGNQTWAYDLTTGLWHERASFSNGQFGYQAPSCCATYNNKIVVGDSGSGNLYALDLTTFTDNGATRKWLRSWPAFPKNQNSAVRFNELMVTLQTGISIPDGTNPQLMLRWADDGGYTWSNEVWADSNVVGATQAYVRFRRLGQSSKGRGLNRIFELSGTDPIPVALLGAELDADPT